MPPEWSEIGRMPAEQVVFWAPEGIAMPHVCPGTIRVDASRAAVAWIEAAVDACGRCWLDGIVTGPVCKEGLYRAGAGVPGQTELLGRLTGACRYAMMLVGGGLRITLVTRHLPLAAVSRAVTAHSIITAVELTAAGLKRLGIRRGAIAVCGLNPHSGDGGAIGNEEKEVTIPAVRALKRRGFNVAGPIAADTVFYRARKGEFDAVVSMYHDQGLPVLKTLAFETGVNLTLGLPFPRTSPDHGTAFDIAGRGIANPASMISAIKLAYELAQRGGK
jgi:4-hydroxythreonine-4-phosphate dehydrogenase